MAASLRFVFLVALLMNGASAANILISSLYGEGSHFMLGASIGEGLVQKGHTVSSLISRAYDHRATDPKYSNLSFEIFEHRRRSVENVRELFHELSNIAMSPGQSQLLDSINRVMMVWVGDCQDLLLDSAFMKGLERYDVIVMDISWPCGLLIRAAIEKNLNYTKKITTVSVSPCTPNGVFLHLLGSSYNPAFQPEFMSGLSNRMTFLQRTANVLQSVTFLILGSLVSASPYEDVARAAGIDPEVANFWTWYKEFDLHLLSMDFSSEFPFPLAPNFIPVGGLTASPAKELDVELEEFVQSSGEHGIILFTLGTYFASVTKSRPGFAEAFAGAFRRLPQKVIWQFADEPDFEMPPNVKIMPWVPQNDLLGHPKTRVFMYQGGNNGFQEASYHGVPVVVMPLYGDQYDVTARIVGRGMGRTLDKMDIRADVIYETLSEVINNPKYTAVAKHVSAVNKNNPMTARERAAFWIDHVIKYGGDYLRSPAPELSFVAFYTLDVIGMLLAILIVIALVIFYMIRFCFKVIYRNCTRSKSKNMKLE